MQISTSAIVLHSTRVSDRSSVLHLYTRECGRIPYLIYGVASRKSPKQAMLMPLALLDIEAVHLENRDLQQLRDWQLAYVPTALSADITRQTVALFIAEILYRTLTHPLPDPRLFDFLERTVHELDTRPDPQNVHLEFLLGFIQHLGFGIDYESASALPFLPLLEGQPIPRNQRQAMLTYLMNYYEEQIPDFHCPKSLDVMMQVFD
ncbi:MAG: DNA repair protein RecO [Bacteroidales bacterium]|nr:DNA repair protein RecO [Candidatus Colicola faecequi]